VVTAVVADHEPHEHRDRSFTCHLVQGFAPLHVLLGVLALYDDFFGRPAVADEVAWCLATSS
jgi:hypothetical protein